MSRRRRGLSPEDIALWRHVTRAVTPMPGRTAPELPAAEVMPEPPKSQALATALKGGTVAPPVMPPKPALKPIVPLERRVRTSLKRGREEIDGVLDLHGMTQDVAHGALIDFLHRMQARGARHVLVITGKGAAWSGDEPPGLAPGQERGVLRRQVPHWLRLPDLRGLVLSFDVAADRHGGGGALYVSLRRRRGEAEP